MRFPAKFNVDNIMDLQVFGVQTIADNGLDTILSSSAPSQEYGPGSVGVVNAVEDPPLGQLSSGRVRYRPCISFRC
jgi:hypothetical protein